MKKLLLLCLFAGFTSNSAFAQLGPAASAEPAPPAREEVAPEPRPATVADAPSTAWPLVTKQASTVAGGVKGRVFAAPKANSKGALPVAATVVVTDNRGVEFRRVRTDKDGYYVADVPPNTYNVEVIPDADWLAPTKVKVVLTRTEHFKVDFHFRTR